MSLPDPAIVSLPAQVLKTYKRLVQYLHEHDLQAGDRLPPQADLRRELGKNNYTLGEAMQALVNQGVLARKTGAGTIVVDRDAIGPVPWSVGVTTIEAPLSGERSVFANLMHRVQTRLHRAGCRCLSYSSVGPSAPTRLDQFGLLQRDLEDGLLDGLAMLTAFNPEEWDAVRAQRIPIVHVLFWEEAPVGVVADDRDLVRQAFRRLTQLGCRRIGVTTVAPPEIRPQAIAGMEDALREAAPDVGAERLDGRFGAVGGERLGLELLARPPEGRPDGLIVTDDFVARGIAQVLAESEGYRPEIVVKTNGELPLAYPLPVWRYAVDLEDLAKRSVNLLRDFLLRPERPNELVLVKAKPCPDRDLFLSGVKR